MKRAYLFVTVAMVGIVLMGAGCGAEKKTSEAKYGDQRGVALTGDNIGNGFGRMNFATGTVADLIVGTKVTVMGTSNTDGSMSATRIMIGDFPGFGVRPTSTGFSSSSPRTAGQSTGGGNRSWSNGQKTGEGRARPATVGMGSTVRGQARVSGIILKKDDSSLVMQEVTGGSKIVFYSDKTEVVIIGEPEENTATKSQ
ncbi:MAG: hypothetical protein WCT40_02170 [Candidatus Magasanikbacteria bacterium]|jgi:hypothetical protein